MRRSQDIHNVFQFQREAVKDTKHEIKSHEGELDKLGVFARSSKKRLLCDYFAEAGEPLSRVVALRSAAIPTATC